MLVRQGTRVAALLKLGDGVGKRNLDVAAPSELRLQSRLLSVLRPRGGLGTEPGVGNELEERCCCFPSYLGLENPARR